MQALQGGRATVSMALIDPVDGLLLQLMLLPLAVVAAEPEDRVAATKHQSVENALSESWPAHSKILADGLSWWPSSTQFYSEEYLSASSRLLCCGIWILRANHLASTCHNKCRMGSEHRAMLHSSTPWTHESSILQMYSRHPPRPWLEVQLTKQGGQTHFKLATEHVN